MEKKLKQGTPEQGRPNSCPGLHYDHPTMPCQPRRACASHAQTEPLFISALSLYLPSFYLSPASSSTLLLCPLLPFCYLSCGSSSAVFLRTAAPFVWDPWVTFLPPFNQNDMRPQILGEKLTNFDATLCPASNSDLPFASLFASHAQKVPGPRNLFHDVAGHGLGITIVNPRASASWGPAL